MRHLPTALLLLAPLAFFPGVLAGRVVSADDHLSVHPAFQEAPGGAVRHPALSDPAVQLGPLRAEALRQLRQGEAPLWNPRLYGGAPLLGDAQSRPFWPGTLLRLALPEDLAQNLECVGLLAAMALGVAAALRALGLAAWPAAVGGLCAAGLPGLHVWLLHPHASTYLAWPWLIWGLERARAGRGGLAPAVFLMALGGHPETAAHGLALGLAWGAARLQGAAAARALASAVAGGLLAAPVWLPVLEQVLRSATLASHGGVTLEAAQLLDLLWPGWHGHPAVEGHAGPGVWADGVLNPGLGALALAAASLGCRAGRALVAAWGLGLALALTAGVGPLNNARLGAEAALLLALAAGFGARALLARLGPRATPALLALALAGGLHARWPDQATLPAEAHAPPPAPWALALAERAGDARVLGLGWVLQPNTGARAGLRDLRGYDLPVSRDTERLMAALEPAMQRPHFPVLSLDEPRRRLLRFGAVRFVVSEAPLPGLPALDLGPAPVGVYALDEDAPRAWLARSAWSAPDAASALRCVQEGRCHRGRPPVEGEAIEGPARLERVTVEEGGRWRRVALPPLDAPALLVNAEALAPGWEAEVDGRPRPLLRVAGAFQGVRVGPGDAVLTLRYAPRGWRWGWALAAVGLVALILLNREGRRFGFF